MLVELLILGTIGAVLFYRYAVRNNDYFVVRNIPALRPSFLFGNAGRFFLKQLRPNEFLEQMYNAMPQHKIFGFFLFRTPVFFATDPQIIKQITVKDFDHFVDHRSFIDPTADDMFSLTLPALSGEKWRQMRATLSPAFTGSKMRQMFRLVSDCGADMSSALRAQPAASLEMLDMKDLFSKFAIDVIASTAFGIKVNSFENDKNEFLLNGRKMLDANNFRTTVKFILMSLFPWLTKRMGMQLFDANILNFFKSMVMETIEMRHREKIHRPDVINLLMQLRRDGAVAADEAGATATEGFATADDAVLEKQSDDKQRTWTDNEIVAQCFLFFAAGFDSISNTLSTLAYELATNVDVQDRLYEECAAVRERLQQRGEDSLPYDVLQQMTYMDQVVTESLRMWPPALFTERMCTKDYKYDDGEVRFEVAENTSVWIPLYALHHDERYFADAKRFDPERFGADRKGSIVPGTYFPFGTGPRNCIASRFALMEMKAAIYHLVLQFHIETCAKTQIPLRLAKNPGGFVLEEGIHLTLRQRC